MVRLAIGAILLTTVSTTSLAENPPMSLGRYAVDLTQTTVSGLSSGAFMANQLHVSYSDVFQGAGIVAGGPFYCAEGSLTKAVDKCMEDDLFGGPDAAASLEAAYRFADDALIAPLANLSDDRVYLFAGLRDETVTPRATDELATFYRDLGLSETAIIHIDDVDAGHAFVTDDFGLDCPQTDSPFIVDCDIDQAGVLLTHLYGPLNPPVETDDFVVESFNQAEFAADPRDISLAGEGFVYVPDTCSAGETCRIHVVLHGCRQYAETLGDTYIRETGYLEWAASNNIILLFPQTTARFDFSIDGVFNPRGCWNWWGYGGDAQYATRQGAQTIAIMGMVDRLASGPR